jgi:hypothetical protein
LLLPYMEGERVGVVANLLTAGELIP